jgi:hypothetical protein
MSLPPTRDRDYIHEILAAGANELNMSAVHLRRVLAWLAGQPEGVRDELLRREVRSTRMTSEAPSWDQPQAKGHDGPGPTYLE